MSEKNIKRINIRMGQELHDWFESKADTLGVPTSALMVIAMNEYRKIQTSADHLPAIGAIYRDFNQLPGNESKMKEIQEMIIDAIK